MLEDDKNPLQMSDDDFLKLNSPSDDTLEAPAGLETTSETESGQDTIVEGESGADTQEASSGEDTLVGSDTQAASTEAAAGGADTLEGASGNDTVSGDTGDKVEETPPDYEALYKKMLAPFKANGRTIELRSPEEAIRLMEMGANYTRKMQALAPHRKVLTMLENNSLLDEAKLSFLIDLDKGDPEAVKKLLKEKGIDPLEIDTSSESAYSGGSHTVSDEELNFSAALEELSSNPSGTETLKVINTRWDQASKDLLWKHPETLAIIHAQREVGIYDRIAEEVDRRKTLGLIPVSTPFVHAYQTVGEELTKADAFADLREPEPDNAPKAKVDPPGPEDTVQKPQPVATRVSEPKPVVANGDAASAASPLRAAPKATKEFINPLAMPDDEFLKQFDGRL